MTAAVDLTGRVFSFLSVLRRHPVNSRAGKARWECQCVCGAVVIVAAGGLLSGNSTKCTACGHKARVTHNGTSDPEYRVWHLMKQRCHNEKHTHYVYYGGRGIEVCKRWRDSYEAFRDDMGRRPFPGAQLDRIDNDGNYEPGNVRWATRKQNSRNQRKTVYLHYNNETRPMPEWAELLGIPYRRLKNRIAEGWSHERALSE